MKQKILFLAPYPSEKYTSEGMFNRINAIDIQFKNERRTYLYVSLIKKFRKIHIIKDNLEIYELNILVHFFKIASMIFSSENIYSHSIHMLKYVWFLIIFFEKRIILDAHGAVPEEIELLEKKSFLYYFLLLTEKVIFSKKNILVICVTNRMKDHFKTKYPRFVGKFIIYSILPEQLYNETPSLNLKINSNKNESIVVLYSGGTAGWQKINMMLQLIENNQLKNIEYIILTNEVEKFNQLIQNFKLPLDRITIKSVPQSELSDYYKIADYGFILRDNHIVNNVANPTKLVEYLFYGIIPIVLTPYIGDYSSYGFEFLSYEEFNQDLKKPNFRSRKNMEVAKILMESNLKTDIKSLVLGKDKIAFVAKEAVNGEKT